MKIIEKNGAKFVTIEGLARLARVSVSTAHNWRRRGCFPGAIRELEGRTPARWLIPVQNADAFFRARNVIFPPQC